MSDHPLFKWRHFQEDIILCGGRWYLRYALSYRDVEELMQERGVMVDHTTIFRWVQRYAPELDKHRFIKRRVNPGLGFGAFATAQRTIQGYEAMHMFRKGQIEGMAKGNVLTQNHIINQLFEVAA